MPYRLHFRRYRLPFRAPVRTSHGPWSVREGLIVRLEDETGAVGFGEAAPLADFGTETIEAAADTCRDLGETVDDDRLASVPATLPCLSHALAAAQASVSPSAQPNPEQAKRVERIGIAALLPAGRAATAALAPKADAGFRVFKWKVGVGDLDEELGLLDDLCAALPSGAKLRLDANGAWDRRRAERWLERCADRPVEFIEQPASRENIDLLLGLANDFPTTLALDESLAADGDVERWLGAGWPGVFVIKPSLHARIPDTLQKLAHAQADVVFSSALETAVGAQTALRAAFSFATRPKTEDRRTGVPESRGALGNSATPELRSSETPALRAARALGFGVWPLFADARFDGPFAAPFIRREDVDRLNPEAVWNALS